MIRMKYVDYKSIPTWLIIVVPLALTWISDSNFEKCLEENYFPGQTVSSFGWKDRTWRLKLITQTPLNIYLLHQALHVNLDSRQDSSPLPARCKNLKSLKTVDIKF